jgi:Mg2+ and Co2+ transporter CorA
MTPTPFEKVSNPVVLSQIGEATIELVKKSEECQIMVREWLDCTDPTEREMLKAVAKEAIKERRECNRQLQLIAELLEDYFNITA